MIVHTVQQGSDSWLALRAGVVTASEIKGVITPKELKASSASAYFNRIVTERIIGEPCLSESETKFMSRGKELEPEAIEAYETEYGYERGPVSRVGFVTTDDGRVGASPDAIVGEDGGLEIKCPMIETHVGYALDPDSLRADYRGQVQVGLYVTGRKWWDLVSFNPHPSMPTLVVVHCEPEPEYQKALAEIVPAFLARVDAAVAKLGGSRIDRQRDDPFA